MKPMAYLLPALLWTGAGVALGAAPSRLVPLDTPPAPESDAVELKNDNYNVAGGQAFLQQGFVEGEKAGIWVKVPETIPQFKVDSFRVLIGDGQATTGGDAVQIFFQMTTAAAPSMGIGGGIENAASLTSGPYWNDVPAQGESGALPCAAAGQYVGAALEFTQSGLPSIYRDAGPIADPRLDLLFAVPGGWNYSTTYGLRGNWVLRIVGHAARPGEC